MVFPMMPVMQPFLMIQILGFPLDEIIKWALVTPVQFSIGWRFHKGAWQALWNRRCARFSTLVSAKRPMAPHLTLARMLWGVCILHGLQTWLHACCMSLSTGGAAAPSSCERLIKMPARCLRTMVHQHALDRVGMSTVQTAGSRFYIWESLRCHSGNFRTDPVIKL